MTLPSPEGSERGPIGDASCSIEDLYRTVIDTTGDGVWIIDAQFRITFVNHNLVELLGHSADELLGRFAFDFVAPGDPPAVADERDRPDGDQAARHEVCLRHKDGSKVWTSIVSTPTSGPAGEYSGAIAVIHDISESRRMIEALRRSEELSAAIVRSAIDCVVTIDEHGRVQEFNPAAERTFGYKRAEVIGRELAELIVPPALRAAHRAGLARVVSGGDGPMLNRRLELAAVRSDGSEFPVELAITRISDEPPRFTGFLRDITEQREAEDELAASYARLADAQALAHIGSWDWDLPSGRAVWSQELLRIFGLSSDETEQTYEAFLQRVHDADRDRVDRTVRSALEAKVPFAYECRILTAGGGVRMIEAQGDFELGPDGEVIRMYGTTQDISERKDAERTLRESRAELQAIIDGSDSAIYVKDRSLRYTLLNKKCEAVFGLSMGEQAIRANDRLVLDSGRSLQVEEMMRIDGALHTYLTQKFPLRDAAGDTYAICGVSTDITAQKDAQEELRRRAERQAVVTELSGQAIAHPELSDLFGLATDAVCKMLGVDYGRVLELRPDGAELVLRSAVGIEPGLVGSACVPATSDSHAGYALTSDGPVVLEDLERETRFHIAVFLRERNVVSGICARIEGKEGPFGVITAHASRSRRFSADEVHFVQAVANVLGGAITRDRAKQLEQQLQQSQRLEAVGQLAGGIAHDFNNLLAVILNYAAFATEALAENEPAREDLGEIEKAAKRAAELTRQLLVFGRREIIDPEPQDVNVIVTDIENLLRRTLGEHIELRVELGAGEPVVLMGSGQLDHILVNLAVNARDAMPTGGRLRISSSIEKFDHDVDQGDFAIAAGSYVRLVVADSGSGMPQDILEQAFDPFFTTKPKGQGTGLGLATVYGAIKQAGGFVRLSSAPDRGTDVMIYLPQTQLEPASRGSGGEDAERALDGDGETVLLVEDEDAVRGLAEKVLTEHGYRVLPTADGDSALAVAKQADGPIDVLLTDVVMPHMSGKELARRLSSQEPDFRLLYMSGYPNDVLTDRGILDEDVVLLEKPFSADQLLAKVRAVLHSG